jgi:hypothetical protein
MSTTGLSAQQAAALDYAERFWKVFPLHTIEDGCCTCGNAECKSPGKHPVSHLAPNGCHDATDDPVIIIQWYAGFPDANPGIATGPLFDDPPGSGFFVIDQDGDAGIETMRQLQREYGALPETLTARTGSGGKHFLFRYPDEGTIRNAQKRLGSRSAPGVDVRGLSGYIVGASSLHHSGRHYSWINPTVAIAEAPPWLLDMILEQPEPERPQREWEAKEESARASLDVILERCPWMAHCRDDATDLGEEEWWGMITISSNCRDGEKQTHELSAPYPGYSYRETQKKIDHARRQNKPLSCREVAKKFGERYCRSCQYREHPHVRNPIKLGLPLISPNGHHKKAEPEEAMEEHEPRAPLDAGEKHLPTITTLAWERLQIANSKDPSIFTFGNEPTRIDSGEHGEPLPRPVTEDRLIHELARATQWDRYNERAKERLPAMPPRPVAKDMLASRSFPLPPLRGIVQSPVFAADGSLSTKQGYHAAAKLYYAPEPGFRVPDVPEDPTAQQLRDAVSLIIDEVLGDFPFTSDSERAHAFEFILLPSCIELVGGPTPIHLFEKPTAGTGAGLLVSTGSLIATGRHPAMMTEGRDEDEWRKRITATLRDSPTFVVIDNLRRTLDSAALSSVVTSTSWIDRKLGVSENLRLPVRCVWAATGNNPAMSSEIARRVVRIRMDAKTDRPWQRTAFRHDNLPAWILENRGALVAACLTIGRAWLSAGSPKAPKAPVLGSFESWARVMGGVLHVAGVEGFLENLDDFYESSDTEGAAIRSFLAAWWAEHGSKPVGVANLFDFATNAGIDLGTGSERSQKTRLGAELRQLKDRHYTLDETTVRITYTGTSSGAAQWKLTTAQQQSLMSNDEETDRWTN